MEKTTYRAHALLLSYPTQGHINPLLQFSKRLVSKGLKATLASTFSIIKSSQLDHSSSSVQIDSISDGYDDGGFSRANSIEEYLASFQSVGSQTLSQLIRKHQQPGEIPFGCVIYDAFLPWALDVAKEFGLVAAAFFTQTCAVTSIFHSAYRGELALPVMSRPVSVPGLPLLLELEDMPSFISAPESYPAYLEMVLNQFCNVEKADYVLVNTFYKLEEKEVDELSKACNLLTIGPTIPSFYSDKRVHNDTAYGLNFFKQDQSTACIQWVSNKPKSSVVYISFGSMASLSEAQMKELAYGLNSTNYYYLWVVRAGEEAKLPKNFIDEPPEKGLLVKWCPQLEVLANHAIGCFFTHCGWNSTSEALSLGVPMVGMPQWTDQATNAKYIEDVWKVGIRVRVDGNGIVGRKEIEGCIREVMEGERGKEMKENAMNWSCFSREAAAEGGTSDNNIDGFVSKLKVHE